MKWRQAIARSNNNEYCAAVPWVSGVQFTKIETLHVRVKFTANGKHQIQAENFFRIEHKQVKTVQNNYYG